MATSALAQENAAGYCTVAVVHDDDNPALNSSISSITVKGFDQDGRIVFVRSGLEPAAILSFDDVPQTCVALGIWYFDDTSPSPIKMATAAVQRDEANLAVITDPDTEAMDACTTQAWLEAPNFKWRLNLSGSTSYSVMQPTVALSKNHVVVLYTANQVLDERYMAIVGKISYTSNGARQITWGSPHMIWDLGAGGTAPNASLNDSGWLVVVGDDENDQNVSSMVCKVKDDLTLSCGKMQYKIAWGQYPSVSIDSSGMGILMYTGDDGLFQLMWYRVVYVNEDSKDLTVMPLHQHDTGIGPRVAINENGEVVEVHQSANSFRPHDLWLNVGKINYDNNTISWGKSQRFATYGSAPVAALTDDGVMMAAYYVTGVPTYNTKSYYRYGLVDFDTKKVTWQDSSAQLLKEGAKVPALSANGLGELGAFVYDSQDPTKGYFGLGQLRQEPLCPWPTVFTHEPYAIEYFEAKSGGNVVHQGDAPATQRGICWSLHSLPTIKDNITKDGSGTGTFTSAMTGLDAGVAHYVRAYAKNSKGVGYGQQMFFKTVDPGAMAPTVTTVKPSKVTNTTAVCGGKVSSAGQSAVTARGVCWSLNAEPTIHDAKTVNGSGKGSFTSKITGLTPGKVYFVRAYATNSLTTGYGQQFVIYTDSYGSVTPISSSTSAGATQVASSLR